MTRKELKAWREKVLQTPEVEAKAMLLQIWDVLHGDGPDAVWSPDTVDRINEVLLPRKEKT